MTPRRAQAQIDAAALEPAGTRPVVHIPKATLTLARTVVVPANKELQIIGDGFSENASRINNTGGATIALRLDGLAVLCCEISGSAEVPAAILITNADQPGGRVFRRDLRPFRGTAASRQPTASINGVEMSDVTFIGSIARGNTRNARRPRRPLRSTGQTAPGQVSAFGCHRTAGSCSTSMTEASSWPRLLVRQAPYVNLFNLDSSGSLTVTNMWLAVDKDPAIPLVRVRGHRGAFNILTTSFTAFGESGRRPA